MTVETVTHELRLQLSRGEWNVGDQFLTFDELQEQHPGLTNIYRIKKALAP